MRYLAIATDYDGTLATHGAVDDETIAALDDARRAGRHLIMVTGRELPDLERVFDRFDLFELIVAENGALLYEPGTKEARPLCDPPPEAFVRALQERGVAPLSVGEIIVATWEPHQETVLSCIHDLGLELQVIFNKGAVMVLPSGVNKATGLAAALKHLGLSPHNCVGIGDAENDHAFLSKCEASIAVANALPALKELCDFTTSATHGAGVAELIRMLHTDDLASLDERLERRFVMLGTAEDGTDVRFSPYGNTLLVAGPSGSGKSTVVSGLVERLCEAGYQTAIIDPEGDYDGFPGAVTLGGQSGAPTEEEIVRVLEEPAQNAAINLLGIPLDDRPRFFQSLLPRLQEMRARTGRPHWIVVDEAHHMLPPERAPVSQTMPRELRAMVFVTVHPDRLAPEVVGAVTAVVATGETQEETMRLVAQQTGRPFDGRAGAQGTALFWPVARGGAAVPFQIAPARWERRRHTRKYAEGDLHEKSFMFRGPERKLNLRAQNLQMFMQMAEGVDDETWEFHRTQRDYSRWMREAIKDPELAEDVAAAETSDGSPAETRARIRSAIEKRYTAPA